MLVVHHLNNSRSQRILWLLEELGAPATRSEFYQRDATIHHSGVRSRNAALAVNSLGKSPVITDWRDPPSPSLKPSWTTSSASTGPVNSARPRIKEGRVRSRAEKYHQWLHYSEGSAMLPLMLNLYTGRLGDAAAPLRPRIQSEMDNHLGYVNSALEGRDWLMGDFTAADVQMSFVGEVDAMGRWTSTRTSRPGWSGSRPGRPM